MINVLIVDDSAFVREFLSKILDEDNEINIIGKASDPFHAVKFLNEYRDEVDVITLDLEMPKMDGLTFLGKIMAQKPLPVVICSSIAEQGSENAIKALELGAVEVITKPKYGLKDFFNEEKMRITEAVKSAAKVDIKILRDNLRLDYSKSKNTTPSNSHLLNRTTNKVIAIGASTGGTIALRYILSKLPNTITGIVITQHMPEGFTKSFSNSLNLESNLDVKESEDNDRISIGTATIAKGNTHLTVERFGAYYHCKLNQNPHVNRHRPSVDVLFESIAKTAGKNALAILLTGMGKDGAIGLKQIKDAGGMTIAQNKESCVVFGMPKAAIDLNAADYVLGLDEIVEQIINFHD